MRPEPVLRRLRNCPVYQPTPLVEIPVLAERLGVSKVWLKDESRRMEIGSFKALGGAYAVVRLVEELGSTLVVCCASAGNHGLSVAAGARAMGIKAVIVLARTVPEEFAARISQQGAQVLRFGETYEESVAHAREESVNNGWTMVADSSWPDYREIPYLVMEGYTVLAREVVEFFAPRETHPNRVFLQAGVGGLAAAVASHLCEEWESNPVIDLVEPEPAACLRESLRSGLATTVEGRSSVMGRLDCKEPSLLALELLAPLRPECVTVSDAQSEAAASLLQTLGYPTSPSGAAGLAGAFARSDNLRTTDELLLILTEGAV